MRIKTRLVAVAIAVTATVATVGAAAPAASATGTTTKAKLTVVHAVPGTDNRFPVDVSVYRLGVGSTVFSNVEYGDVVDALPVDAGIYWIGIRAAGSPRYSTPILSRWVWMWPGSNKSVVAHLDANGNPRISVYGTTRPSVPWTCSPTTAR
jgi:hypothetical protein